MRLWSHNRDPPLKESVLLPAAAAAAACGGWSCRSFCAEFSFHCTRTSWTLLDDFHGTEEVPRLCVFFSDSGPGQKNRLYRIGIYIELQRPFGRLAVTTSHTRAPWLYRFGCVRTRGRKCETKRPHHSLCEDGVTSIKNTETLKYIGQWCAGGDGPRVADRARLFPVRVGRGSSLEGKVKS